MKCVCVHVCVCVCMCVCVIALCSKKGSSNGKWWRRSNEADTLHTPVSPTKAHPFSLDGSWLSLFSLYLLISSSPFGMPSFPHFLAPLPSSSPSALHHETHPQFTQWGWLISSPGFCLCLVWNSLVICLILGLHRKSNSCHAWEDQGLWFTSRLSTVLSTQ